MKDLLGRFKKGSRREKSGNWKGGQTMSSAGYVLIKLLEHPFSDHRGYIKRSRLVMEKHLGRVLLSTEVVHHINGIKDDDRIENLMLFSSSGEHMKFHYPLRLKIYNRNCAYCKKVFKVNEISRKKYCSKDCINKARRKSNGNSKRK